MLFKKLLIGASIAASVSAIASTPAFAGSLTNATIGGSAASDYLVYGVEGNKTKEIAKTQANLQAVLDGNASNPTGNVELRASSEKAGFDFTKNTTLSGKIGGKDITLSSLTAADWTPNFVNTWLTAALNANGFSQFTSQVGFLSNIFVNYGGMQRFSDPNISYVNQNDTTGEISIGLAGHLNANTLLTQSIDSYMASLNPLTLDYAIAKGLKTTLGTKQIQASEIVKVSYNGGPSQLLYNFKATETGLTELSDGVSHSGNYEVKFAGIAPPPVASVPEPSVMLGLVGVFALFVTQRQLKKAQ